MRESRCICGARGIDLRGHDCIPSVKLENEELRRVLLALLDAVQLGDSEPVSEIVEALGVIAKYKAEPLGDSAPSEPSNSEETKTGSQSQADPTIPEIDLKAALRSLVDALEKCHADPRFQTVWTIYQIHGGRYEGPFYKDELAVAVETLQRGSEEQTKRIQQ